MSDRFKFRVWDKINKRFEQPFDFYAYYIGMDGGLYEFVSNCDESDSIVKSYDENYIIQQCTGLRDSKGELIFEGDIVLLSSESTFFNFEIKWQDGSFRLCYGKNAIHSLLDSICPYFKIIGNIFERPELLEKS